MTRFVPCDVAGLANVQTGDLELPLAVESEVLLTDEVNVCPRCNAGTCNSGPRQGMPCAIDGVVTVDGAASPDHVFNVSKGCPPPTDLHAGTFSLALHLTTATSILGPSPGGSAETPCVAQPGDPSGLAPRPDSCPVGGTCTAACEGLRVPHDGSRLRDRTPGVRRSERRARTDVLLGQQGIAVLSDRTGQHRTGHARRPSPCGRIPATRSRTVAQCTGLAATFCLSATGTLSVDGALGLPGPGALLLPVTQQWLAPTVDAAAGVR